MTVVGEEASLRPTVKNDSHGSVKVGEGRKKKRSFASSFLPQPITDPYENILVDVVGG